VTNLLHNAIKYTDPHGTITLAVSSTEQEIVLSVQDTGMGISAELLPHVFDLFVQSERSLDRSQGGLGIGLSVVRRLVGLHHGTLQAHSAGLGQGSIFEIRLPRISAPDSLVEAVVVKPGTPRQILIVDDNPDAADTLALLLTSEGHIVDVVYRSTDALDRVAQQHPDVVFLDLGMPVMDGYALARAIRARHGNALRLIALTGYGMPEDRKRTAAAGFDAHLVKPVDVETLLSNVAWVEAGPQVE
jgi:CheY-like chemotaxis protein